MKFIQIYLLLGTGLLRSTVSGLGGTEEKFIKKYAMMKVYESCFGIQVLKEIRREMREAAQKCSGIQIHPGDRYSNKDGTKQTGSGDWHHQEQSPSKAKPVGGTKVKKPIHTADTLLLQQWSEEQKRINAEGSGSEKHDQVEGENEGGTGEIEPTTPSKKPVDLTKLEEAILNIGRPMASFPGQKPNAVGNQYHQPATLGYYPPMYYPAPMPFPPSFHYQPFYPGYFTSQSPMGSGPYQHIYRNGVRSAKITNFNGRRSRQSADFQSHIESIGFQYNTRARNVSCIMQELGYLDENLEPNYSRMTERIGKLQIEEELKKDMLSGVKFCRQFSQCIPDTRHESSQLSKEFLRPMFFFRCYKHKKLESCIMKDIRGKVKQSSSSAGGLTNEVRRSLGGDNDIIGSIFDSVFGYGEEEFEASIF